MALSEPISPAETREAPRTRSMLQRFLRRPVGVAAAVFILLLVLVAIFAPMLAPHDPLRNNYRMLLAPPFTPGYPLGTDDLGRDVLSRLIHSTRVAVMAPLIAISITLGLGLIPGLIAGFLGGWVDSLIMRMTDALQSFPSLLLAMGLIAVFGPGLVNAMIAVGIVFTPAILRVVRGSVLQIRKEQYVEAAITIGTPLPVILARHILPNVIGPLLVQVSLLIGLALLAEATLGFIGLGQLPPAPSWGGMLQSGFSLLSRQPWLWVWPALLLSATVLAFNLIGDALRDSVGQEERR